MLMFDIIIIDDTKIYDNNILIKYKFIINFKKSNILFSKLNQNMI